MGNTGRKRSEELRTERKKQILDSARKLFVTQGYDATTMQQVVQDAGTSIGNCYFYFPNKEALLHAIVEDISQEIWNKVDEASGHLPAGATQLAVSFYVFIQVLLEQAEVFQLVFMGNAHIRLRLSFLEYFSGALKKYLEKHPDLLAYEDVDLAITAWSGATVSVLERILEGHITYEKGAVERFLVNWNLQAFGIPDARVQNALENLDRWLKTGSINDAST
ncbi:MAG: TetR/AcrR family transcriptional regulator [SAR324 cluster bacterium]|nr:TetR/AcrR family transcriptional regulator [SAR324 cluster bacterium]